MVLSAHCSEMRKRQRLWYVMACGELTNVRRPRSRDDKNVRTSSPVQLLQNPEMGSANIADPELPWRRSLGLLLRRREQRGWSKQRTHGGWLRRRGKGLCLEAKRRD